MPRFGGFTNDFYLFTVVIRIIKLISQLSVILLVIKMM